MSGSSSYTEEEIQVRTEQLQAGAITLDRNKVQLATDLVTGVQDLVYRTLNSDVDSVYALLRLLANKHVIMASKILSNLDLLERYAPVSRQEQPNPDTSKLTRLIEISDDLAFVGAGEREKLIKEFSRVTESLVKSSVTPGGFQNSGISPIYAKEQSVALASETEFLLGVLLEEIPRFRGALLNYSSSSLEPLSFENQAKKAAGVLKKYAGEEDLSGAILDSVVLSSLLSKRAESKRDIVLPKYEGAVTTLPGSAAEMYGGTKPFIIQDTVSSVDFAVDSSSAATVSGAQSGPAEISVLLTSEVFAAKEDYGTLFSQTTANSSALQKWFSSSGTDSEVNSPQYGLTTDDLGNPITAIPYLKSAVRPAGAAPDFTDGVRVDFSYWTWAGSSPTGPSVDVSCVDNGVDGTLVDTALTTITSHTLTSDSGFNGTFTSFTFTGVAGVGSFERVVATGTGSLPVVVNLTGTTTETWKDVSHQEDPNNPGYYTLVPQLGNLPSSTVSLNYNLGHVIMDLGSYAPTSSQTIIVDDYSHRIIYGVVDYASGHVLVKMPSPATNSSSLVCDYGYYPLALISSVDTTPGVYPPPISSFGSIGLYAHNTLSSETLSPPSSKMPYLPAGAPSDWITDATKLASLIQASSPTDWAFSHGAEGSNYKYTFSSNLCGSMSRVAFPNYTSAELNVSTALAPTWTTKPSTINQAIFALYSAQGERFGKDTQFSDLSVSDSSVGVTCSGGTLFRGVPITSVSSSGEDITIDLSTYTLTVGDNLHVRWDGAGTSLSRTSRSFHTKVLSIDSANDLVTVYPALALPINDAPTTGLSTGGTWACDISRGRIRARSQSTASSSSLAVSNTAGSALGFDSSSATTGFSTSIKLQVGLHGTSPRDGYEIHPNDVVLENYTQGINTNLRVLGYVLSVAGDELTIALADNVQPETYPYGDLKIVSLGWHRFMEVQRPLTLGMSSLREAMGEGGLSKFANVFVQSGSGQGQYMSLLYSLKTAVEDIRKAYLGYDAHIVKTVDTLLNTLKQERLTLPLDMLMMARFTDLSNMTVTEVSDQTSIDNLLLAAFDQMGGETDFFEITHNADHMDDYYSLGKDDKYDPEPYVENAGDLL